MQNIEHDDGQSRPKNKDEIQAWLVQQVSELLNEDPHSIDVLAPFNSYGLSSKDSVMLSGDLEDWLDRRLSPTLVYEYPTINSLAEFLSSETPVETAETRKPRITGRDAEDAYEILPTNNDQVSRLEALSEDEAEALLLDKLNKLSSQ